MKREQTRRQLASVVIGLLALGSTAACQKAGGDGNELAAGGRLAPELDPLVEELFSRDLSPGLAVAVVTGDELAYARGFGYADMETGRPVTPETLFYIASTTKAFTALAAALLDHRELLDLDAPISRYVAELELQPPLSADEITVRNLLTHTHGIEDGGPVVFRTAFTGEFTEEQLIRLLEEYGPSESGRAFRYGNLGYNLAGIVLERVRGETWKVVVDEEVLQPLGMASTSSLMSRIDMNRLAMPHYPTVDGFRRIRLSKADENMHAAGGLVTSVLDLARWLEVQVNEGRLNDRTIFPAEVVRETQRRQVDQDREFSFFHRHGWGLGWDIGTYEQDTLVHRFGSYPGYRPHVSFMPQHDIGIAVLVNDMPLGGRLADLVAIRIYDHLLGKPGTDEKWAQFVADSRGSAAQAQDGLAEDLARRAARQGSTRLPLSSYVGTYESEDLGTMEWRESDDGLEVNIGLLRGPAEVFDAERDMFRIELRGRGEVIRFRVEDGEVLGLSYLDREFAQIDP